ncbi:MAG: NADPH-dependent oxidoreductase [Armatimonadetes bacterium]|nr:NADPH-dependent oxidoreductase [Armatimonadota bacterium]
MFEESFLQAWELRYGAQPSAEYPELARFLNHRSVRTYSPKPIPESLVAALIGCAQSAATSSNLQLWSVVSVQDPERREKIAELAGDQDQIRNATWFLAFIADHHRIREAAGLVGEDAAGLDYTEFELMACIDAALAAERLVCAAESLGIGICYIGALRNNPDAISGLLGLPEGTFGVFGLCLGYPAEDANAPIKPRFGQSEVWFREIYPSDLSFEDHDRRASAFYDSQKMKGDVNWSMRSGRRVDGNHMTGREVLKEWLAKKGFGRR